MREAVSPHTFATDLSVQMALEGKPFREAYREVGRKLGDISAEDVDKSLRERVSPGACADLMLDELEARLSSI